MPPSLQNLQLYVSCGELWFGATPELEQQILEVSVVGEGGVGKSCITLRFTQNQFHHYYDPTIEDMHRQHVHLKEDGSSYRLHILDTAGEEEYMAMRHGWMEHKDGLLLVFSLASRESFLSLRSVVDSFSLSLSLSLLLSLCLSPLLSLIIPIRHLFLLASLFKPQTLQNSQNTHTRPIFNSQIDL